MRIQSYVGPHGLNETNDLALSRLQQAYPEFMRKKVYRVGQGVAAQKPHGHRAQAFNDYVSRYLDSLKAFGYKF